MKKAYVKPVIMFESFSLSTNIAGDCERQLSSFGVDATNTDFNSCGIFFESKGVVFSGTWGGCEEKVYDPSGSWNTICYDVPSESYNLYNS